MGAAESHHLVDSRVTGGRHRVFEPFGRVHGQLPAIPATGLDDVVVGEGRELHLGQRSDGDDTLRGQRRAAEALAADGEEAIGAEGAAAPDERPAAEEERPVATCAYAIDQILLGGPLGNDTPSRQRQHLHVAHGQAVLLGAPHGVLREQEIELLAQRRVEPHTRTHLHQELLQRSKHVALRDTTGKRGRDNGARGAAAERRRLLDEPKFLELEPDANVIWKEQAGWREGESKRRCPC